MRTICLFLLLGIFPAFSPAQTGAKHKPETIYEVEQLDAQPMYPGGPSALFDMLQKYIPDSLARYDGKLELSFIVYSNGQVNEVRLSNGSGRYRQIETAIFQNMPKWKAGKKAGKAVSCRYKLIPHLKK
jgi:hypothetical protein